MLSGKNMEIDDGEKLIVLVKERAAVYNCNSFQAYSTSDISVIDKWRRELPNKLNNVDGLSTAKNGKQYFHNPFLIAVQSKFRRKYYHKAVFVILLLIILILFIAIIVIACKAHTALNVCETKECLRTAANLLQTMDQTVDPCEDFYQFTCGNWAEEHPRPDSVTSYDWFSDKQTKVMRTIRKFLQANESNSDPEAIIKIKTMYRACMNLEAMNDLGFTPLLAYLKEYKLPSIPTFLNKSESENGTTEYDWIESLANIKISLGMDILIGLDIFADPTNRTNNRLALGVPESGSSLPFNDDEHQKRIKRAKKKFISDDTEEEKDEKEEKEPTESPALRAYLSYIKQVIAKVVLFVEPDTNLDDINENLNSAALETVRITKFVYKLTQEAENSTKSNDNPLEDFLNLSTEELQKSTDEPISPKSLPIWEKFLKIMFGSIEENQKFDIKSGKILTSKADVKFLQAITQFVTETPLPNIELYIWWCIVEELILHTTSEMRTLHNEYTKIVIKTEGTTSRSLHCTTGINSLMGMAVSYAIADEKFLEESRPKVETMLSNIREAFGNLVEATSWMDASTKSQTLEKSANMKSFIGFPDWILNKTTIDAHYSGLEVYNNTHLDNMMGILKWKMHKKLTSLDNPDNSVWATAPSNVNAFHTFQSNTITIPIAILQYPFYDLGLEALNYGAIGTILGHELTHGFDDSGRMFDKCGNMRQWWTNRTITEYINRTSCFIKQYGNFYLPDIGQYVDGELTLGENIADNGGLREAYYAYKILVNNIGIEKSLPGFEKYTNEQLLFISFGNLWCETYTPAATRYSLEDTHCPGRIRLRGVLSNSPEFSSTFGCRKGSGMYPTEDRCRIW